MNKEKIKENFWLTYSIAKANFKLKNKGSYLGFLWYVLEPTIFFLILITLRKSFASNIEQYPLYLLIGLMMYNLFNKVSSASTKIIEGNSNFIKNMNINKKAIVLSLTVQNILNHVAEILILGVFMVVYEVNILLLLAYILVLAIYILFISGISLILASIGAYIKDLSNIWTIISKILFFITPVFYVVKTNNESLLKIIEINPLYQFMKITRMIIIENEIPQIKEIVTISLIGVLTLIAGIKIFDKLKLRFAEVI